MDSKVLFTICLQIVLVQYARSQCIGKAIVREPIACNSGVFTSPLTMENMPWPAPSFSVFSDGLIVEGIVGVTGTLPFLGTVGMQGALPAAGQGSVMYKAGDGDVGITAEIPAASCMYPVRY